MEALSREERDRFQQEGFLGPFAAFTPREMETFEKTIRERVWSTPCPYDSYGRARHLDSATVWRLCSAPAIVERMASLFGPNLVLWFSSFFHKEPISDDRVEEYPWHQDVSYWNLEPNITISAWLAITPATTENGCVEVIPRSHKHILPTVAATDQRYSPRFGGRRTDPEAIDERSKIPLLLEPGQFFLFTERTLHRSGPNRSDKPRTGLSMRVTLPAVKLRGEHPCLLLRGEDTFRLNTYAPPPNGEPDLGKWPGGLPEARRFVFDRMVPGIGWHSCERSGDIPFCWTGPANESWIVLRINDHGDQRFRCRLLHAREHDIIGRLQIRVNGHAVHLQPRAWSHGLELEAHVPASALDRLGEFVRIDLQTAQMIRGCDIDQSSSDVRQRGVAVHAIEFEPLP